MTGKDLLIGIGNISHKYYEEAENAFLSEPQKHRTLRRPLLVAAIVALTLLLVGCAITYLLRKESLHIGSETIQGIELEVLSSQGIKDTSNYLANQEWLEFTQNYTPELKDYWDSEEAYWVYGVRDQSMVDKVDEICEKYGLNVIGKPWHEHVDCMEFLPLLGVDQLLKQDSEMTLAIPQGRFFPGGSFNVYGSLVLPNGNILPDFYYNYIKKDVFYDVFTYLNPDIVTERNYTSAEGVTLLLLESSDSGMIMADREDCFIALGLRMDEGVTLEEIADQFDFMIQTAAPDPIAADVREQSSIAESRGDDPFAGRFERDNYEEYVEDVLWSDQWKLQNGFAPDEIPDRGCVLYDLDGNGEEELLVFYDGYIGNIISRKNGKTTEGKTYHMMLCENNVLIDISEFMPGERWYHIFYFANDGDPVFSNPKEQSIVRLKEQHGNWWRTSSTDHYADFDTQITVAEAMEILNAYKPITLDIRSLEEFGQS